MRHYEEEKNIEAILKYETEDIEVPSDLFNRIRKNIYEEEQKIMSNGNIKFGRKKRNALVAGLCVLVGSITVIAGGLSDSWSGHSYVRYTTFPTQEEIQKDNGFTPKYVESLPGGFKFMEASVGESELTDEKGNKVGESKDIDFSYIREGEEQCNLFLSTSLVDEAHISNEERETDLNYQGIDLYYDNQTYKFVPEDYMLTEEDNKGIAKGELEVSYGTDEVSLEQIQSISWYEDGISYLIMGNDYNFEASELVEMAKTVIDVE